MEIKFRVTIFLIFIFYFDDALNIQKQKLMFAQSQESESQAKYNLDAVTQKTVHYPDNNIMSNICLILKCLMKSNQCDLSF